MKRIVALLLFLFVVLGCPIVASAEEVGTREEAIGMVHRVKDKAARDGLEATFAAVTGQEAEFKIKDLYPFIYSMDGINLAHGANPKMVGKLWITTKDQDGNYLIKEMVRIATSPEGRGWWNYKWPNPVSHKIQDKSAYVEKLEDKYFVGVGVYVN